MARRASRPTAALSLSGRTGGKDLFYRNGDMMTVSIAADESLRVGTPVLLFEGALEPSVIPDLTNYDVARDDRRFIMLEPTEQPAGPRTLRVVLNWYQELLDRVPVP